MTERQRVRDKRVGGRHAHVVLIILMRRQPVHIKSCDVFCRAEKSSSLFCIVDKKNRCKTDDDDSKRPSLPHRRRQNYFHSLSLCCYLLTETRNRVNYPLLINVRRSSVITLSVCLFLFSSHSLSDSFSSY